MRGIVVLRLFIHGVPFAYGGDRCLIIDTDMDLDDAMAVMYGCRAGLGDLRAITVAGTGFFSTAERGAGYARRLLKLCGRKPFKSIRVAAGLDRALANTSFHFPQEWSHKAEQFFDEALPHLDSSELAMLAPSLSEISAAAQLIIDTARECQQEGIKLDIVAIAPMTNIAEALVAAPSLMRSAVRSIFFSGGNINGSYGNDADCGGGSNTAECNVFADALAAARVFNASFHMYVLDSVASRFLPVPAKLPSLLRAARGQDSLTPMQDVLIGTLETFLQTSTHQLYFYDHTVAVWERQRKQINEKLKPSMHWRYHPDGFCNIHKQLNVRVSLEDSPDSYGTLIQDSKAGCTVDFCWVPDETEFFVAFFTEFFSTDIVSIVLVELQTDLPLQSLIQAPLPLNFNVLSFTYIAIGALFACAALAMRRMYLSWEKHSPTFTSPLLL